MTVLIAYEESRRNGIHTNTVTILQGHFACQPLCKVGYGCFRCRIARHTSDSTVSRHRRYVDNASLFLFSHHFAENHGWIDCTVHIQTSHFFPTRNIHIIEVLVRFESRSRHVSTCDIQKNVNPSPLGNNLFGYFFQTGSIQYVADNTDYVITILL